jgi:hypothetical protein
MLGSIALKDAKLGRAAIEKETILGSPLLLQNRIAD